MHAREYVEQVILYEVVRCHLKRKNMGKALKNSEPDKYIGEEQSGDIFECPKVSMWLLCWETCGLNAISLGIR